MPPGRSDSRPPNGNQAYQVELRKGLSDLEPAKSHGHANQPHPHQVAPRNSVVCMRLVDRFAASGTRGCFLVCSNRWFNSWSFHPEKASVR